MKEFGEKLPADKKEPIQKKIDEVKKLLEDSSTDLETLKAKESELMAALQEIGQAMYGKEGANPGNGQPQPEPSASESSNQKKKVVDADFEVVDDGKKS